MSSDLSSTLAFEGQILCRAFETAISCAEPAELGAWQHENGRFLIWAQNWSLFRHGSGSLDARLQNNPLLKSFLKHLLTDGRQCLEQLSAAVGAANTAADTQTQPDAQGYPSGGLGSRSVVDRVRNETNEVGPHAEQPYGGDEMADEYADEYADMPESLLALAVVTTIVDRLYRSSKVIRKANLLHEPDPIDTSTTLTVHASTEREILAHVKPSEEDEIDRFEPKHIAIAEEYHRALFRRTGVHSQVHLDDIQYPGHSGPRSAASSLPPSSVFSHRARLRPSIASSSISSTDLSEQSSQHTFAFRVRHIREKPPDTHPSDRTPVSGHWRPPTNRTHFALGNTFYSVDTTSYHPDQAFLWSPGRVTPLPGNPLLYLTSYNATSIFWSSDRGGFLIVPYDCTKQNVDPYPEQCVLDDSDDDDAAKGTSPAPSSRSWRRLTFGRDGPDTALARVGYHQKYYRLGAPVPEEWRLYLVPPTQEQGRRDDLEQPTSHQCAQLAGDLATLIGLCAMGATPQNFVRAIRDSFRPKPDSSDWVRSPHIAPFHHRNEDRGVVVEIFCDQDPASQQALQDWEDGKYGPILT